MLDPVVYMKVYSPELRAREHWFNIYDTGFVGGPWFERRHAELAAWDSARRGHILVSRVRIPPKAEAPKPALTGNKRKGFASMTPERRREVAAKGGRNRWGKVSKRRLAILEARREVNRSRQKETA